MSDPDLTPAQEESVRALLASARHTEPAPSHVVARLDETLAGLVAERREVRAPVVTLASRRRGVVSKALLAAAAVVALGVGVTEVLPSLSQSSNDSAATSGESVEDQSATNSERSFDAQEGSPEAGTQPDQRSDRQKTPLTDTAASELTSTSPLGPQVRALFLSSVLDSSYAEPACPVSAAGSIQVSVTYDGQPGTLVYRTPVAGRQQVDVHLCGDVDPVRSVRIRAR